MDVSAMLGSTFFIDSFRSEGFYQFNQLIPPDYCNALKYLYKRDVKEYPGELLRQRSVTYEKHKLTSCDYVENALLDIHRKDLTLFNDFTQAALDIFGFEPLAKNVTQILGVDPVLVQSMYFESSKGTPEHFDRYFLGVSDSDPMLGIWIALEDIDVSAGRFYVYPGSHDHEFQKHANSEELRRLMDYYREQNAIAVNGHQGNSRSLQLKAVMECKRTLKKMIRCAGWKKLSPNLKQGDVIVFSINLLHGSDMPSLLHASRNSLTGHFVASPQKQIRYGDVFETIDAVKVQGVNMHRSKRYEFQNLAMKTL